MKKIFPFRLGLVLTIFLLVMICMSSCGTSNGMPNQASGDSNVVQPTVSETWSTLLSRVAGLDVRGAEPNLSVRIRGDNSIELSNEPLFVLDGVQLGQDFSRLAGAVLPKDVESIHVLKGAAAARYGDSSGNGVIVVKSKE